MQHPNEATRNFPSELVEEFWPSPRWTNNESSPPLGELTVNAHSVVAREYPDHLAEGGTVLVAEDGQDKATMSFMAYSKPSANPRRPLTLVMNGGPLSAGTLWNQNELFSPQVLRHKSDGHLDLRSVPETNMCTLLEESDLVFLDPVGTGYGKPLLEVDATHFFGVENDAAIALAFLEEYLDSHNRHDAPIILAGSSYAAFRMTAIANMLQQKNRDAAALLLISGSYDYSLNVHDEENPDNNRLSSVTNLPSFAVAALYHNLTPSKPSPAEYYNQVTDFARVPYAQALRANKQPRDLAAQIAAFIGLDTEVIQDNQLQVPVSVFQKSLLGKQGLMLSGIDGRLAFQDTQPINIDPALDSWESHYKQSTKRRFSQLGYDTKGNSYNGNLAAYPQWSFANDWQGRSAAVAMRSLLNTSPGLRIVEVTGLYDLLGNRQKREIFWQQLLPECEPWQQKNIPINKHVPPAAQTISTYEVLSGHQPGVDPFSQDAVGKLACRLAAVISAY